MNNQPGPVEQDSEDKDSEDEDSTLLSTVVFNVHVEKGNESLVGMGQWIAHACCGALTFSRASAQHG